MNNPNERETAFTKLFRKTGGFHFSDIRPSRLIYFLAYTFELMLFAARGQFLPIGADIFGLRAWTLIHAVHMAASLIFMLLWKEKFKKLIYVSVIMMIAGFLPFVFMPVGLARSLFAALFYIGLGGAVTSARCGFAFAANNTERFAGMLIMFFSVAVMRFVRSLGAEGIIVSYVLPLLLLASLCFCLLKFQEADFEIKAEASPGDKKGLYWAFAFFALYFAFDGYNAALVDGYKNPDFLFFFIGMLLAGLFMFFAIGKLRLNTWHIWNLFLIASFCMGLFAQFAQQLGTEKPQYLFGGLSMIGWPLCIYTLGCAQRRFASYKLLKQCTLIYVLLSPVLTVSSDLVESYVPSALPLVSMLFILFFGIAFLMLSPFSYKYLFFADWLPDIYKPDMSLPKNDSADNRFDEYKLTPRQKEIALLLLGAKTGRQIAGELGLSESTVKMHTSQLYKRLGINSRAELFRLFGVGNSESNQQK